MKRILLAVGLGLGVLTFTMAGTVNSTIQAGAMINDTTPEDTTKPDQPSPDQPTPDQPEEPTPQPDTTTINFNY